MGVTTVRLQPDVEESLVAAASRLQRSKSWLINQALREYIERESVGEARWKETLAALESVRLGQVASGEAVHEWLRSWGSNNEKDPPKAGS